MPKFISIFRSNLLIASFALIIGGICVSHHGIISWKLHKLDKQYYPLVVYDGNYDELIGYAPRVKEFMEGRRIVSDLALYEYKGYPAVFSILNPVIFGLLTHFSGSIKNTFIISDFIFPAIAFLLLYYLGVLLCKNRLYSILFGCLMIFQYKLGNYLPPINLYRIEMLVSLFQLPETIRQPLKFTKFEAPQLTIIPFVLSIIFLLLALKSRNKIYSYLAGLFIGILFYSYLYSWLYVSIGLIFLGLFYLIKRDKQLLKLLLIAGLAGIVSSYYWINFISLRMLPQYQDIVSRLVIERGHHFRLFYYKDYIIWGVLCLILWFLGKRRGETDKSLVLISLILSGIFCFNIQVITGSCPETDHWFTRAVNYGLILGYWMSCFWFYLEIKKFIQSDQKRKVFSLFTGGLIVVFIILSIGYGVKYHLRFAHQKFREFTVSPELMQAFEWLNENSERDSVVLTPCPETILYLLTYTHNNSFLPNSAYSLAPQNELEERLVIASKLSGITKEYLAQLLSSHSEEYMDPVCFFLGTIHHGTKQNLRKFLRYDERLSMKDRIIKLYDRYDVSIREIREKFRLDYVFWGPYEYQKLRRFSDSGLPFRKVYENHIVTIYKFI